MDEGWNLKGTVITISWWAVVITISWWTPWCPTKETEYWLLKSDFWSKTAVLKYGKVNILNCVHQMTVIPTQLHASVEVGIPARELPA